MNATRSDPRTCECQGKPYREGMLLHSCKVCSSQALDYFRKVVDIPSGIWYNGFVDQVTGRVVVETQKDWTLEVPDGLRPYMPLPGSGEPVR